MPTTRLGLWAVRLLAVFAASFVVAISFVAVGEIIAGDEAFDSLWLTVPLMVVAPTAVLAGLLAGTIAAFAIVKRACAERGIPLSLAQPQYASRS